MYVVVARKEMNSLPNVLYKEIFNITKVLLLRLNRIKVSICWSELFSNRLNLHK